MLTPIFVDTLFVVALINTRDQYHLQAVNLADKFEGFPLLITEAVLLELGNALARNYKPEAVAIIEQFLSSDEVAVVPFTHDTFERAFKLYRDFQDKAWGLVDCVSFIAMRDAGMTEALTFDQHFVQAGFHALMR